MNIVFMGSAELACPSLLALLGDPGCRVVGVVTQPPRPRGRRLQVEACAVGRLAAERGAAVLNPVRVNEPASLGAVRDLAPDMIVVVAYGQILGRELLGIPPLGCVNVHASLLPHYRGAAPIQWAIARGETVTGVTTMYMNERMDDGDIIFRDTEEIGPEDTAETLGRRLAERGAGLLLKTLAAISTGVAPREPQDRSRATFAPRLTKQDGEIDWTQDACAIYNRVRAFEPWPGSACTAPVEVGGGRLGVHRCRVEEGDGVPGEVLDCAGGALVAAGRGAVRLLSVQPAGRKAMDGVSYVHGHRLRNGLRFGGASR